MEVSAAGMLPPQELLSARVAEACCPSPSHSHQVPWYNPPWMLLNHPWSPRFLHGRRSRSGLQLALQGATGYG